MANLGVFYMQHTALNSLYTNSILTTILWSHITIIPFNR